jgi:N-acetylglutamate synthase-like GNAT family acetyltransferase
LQLNRFGELLLLQVARILRAVQVTRAFTYADDLATGFFTRLGFTTKLSVSREWLASQLIPYTKSTLMQCDLLGRM